MVAGTEFALSARSDASLFAASPKPGIAVSVIPFRSAPALGLRVTTLVDPLGKLIPPPYHLAGFIAGIRTSRAIDDELKASYRAAHGSAPVEQVDRFQRGTPPPWAKPL